MLNHKTRFAPSPNGKLHIGHAFSAIISEKIAKKYDGEFLVRIEDIDASRSSKKNIKRIIDDLKWLNIKFEDKKIRRQSKFYDIYEHFLKKLRDLNLIYPCWATRSEIKKSIIQNQNSYRNWNIDPDGQYIYQVKKHAKVFQQMDLENLDLTNFVFVQKPYLHQIIYLISLVLIEVPVLQQDVPEVQLWQDPILNL